MDIYTDGASRGNPGLGAAGFYIPILEVKIAEVSEEVTNNKMELRAINLALDYLCSIDQSTDKEFNVYTDSQLCIGYFTKNWRVNSNIELVTTIKSQILKLYEKGFTIKFIKVKGHSDCEGNNMIDKYLNEKLDEYAK